jgi:hypothetical protein
MPLFTSELSYSDDYPTIEPSLKLDFANARALDPRITFTRASTATYVGRDGLVKYAGEDEARFDHDPTTGESLGLLIEETRTNLLPESEDLTSGLITELAITTSNDTGVIAPDGTAGATRVIQDNTTAQHLIGDTAGGLTLGGNYALSCFVKAGTTDLIWFSVNSYLNWVDDWNFYINLTTGNVYGNSNNISNANLKVEEYPNGWWKLSMVAQQEPAGGGAGGLWLGHADPNGTLTTNVAGDGSTYFYAWGLQMEAGAYPTSYIPTSGSTAARVKDLPTIETSSIDFHDFSQGGEGTLLCEFSNANTIGSDIAVSFSGDTHNGGTFIGLGSNTNNDPFVRNRVNSTNTVLISDSSATTTGYHLVAYGIGQSRSTIAVRNSTNGVQEDTSVSYDTTPYTKIIIGCDQIFTDNNTISGTIKKLFYYPTLLSDTQLQTLTQ